MSVTSAPALRSARAQVLSCIQEPQNMPAPPAVRMAMCMRLDVANRRSWSASGLLEDRSYESREERFGFRRLFNHIAEGIDGEPRNPLDIFRVDMDPLQQIRAVELRMELGAVN